MSWAGVRPWAAMRRLVIPSLVLALVGLGAGCGDDGTGRAVSADRAEQCLNALGAGLERAGAAQLHGLIEGATAALGDGPAPFDPQLLAYGDGPVIVFAADDETAQAVAERLGYDRAFPDDGQLEVVNERDHADDGVYRTGQIVVYLGDATRGERVAVRNCI